MKIPKIGDLYFLESYDEADNLVSGLVPIEEVGGKIANQFGTKGVDILIGNCWYDCFWSEKNQRFQYSLDEEEEEEET